jgi:hypothetical protein
MPEAVLDTAIAGKDVGFLAENRRVTVMFVGLPLLQRSSLSLAQLALQRLQEAMVRLEGTLRQFLSDDKGTVCIVAFGLPPHSHKDDASRAVQVRCAILVFFTLFIVYVVDGVGR